MTDTRHTLTQKLVRSDAARDILTDEEYHFLLFDHPKPDGLKALAAMGPARQYCAWDLKRAYEEQFNGSYDWHEYSDLLSKAARLNLVVQTKTENGLAYYKKL